MSYWIFKADPNVYRLDDRLNDPEPTNSWRVTKYKDEIQNGDTAFIWRTGRDRGIRAVMRIDSAPVESKEIETEQKYLVERDTRLRYRVKGTLTHRFPCISHRELRNMPDLENLSVLSKRVFQSGTNFKVTDDEGKILLALANARS